MLELLLATLPPEPIRATTHPIETPAPQPTRTMYEVSYYIPGSGIEHALRFDEREECDIVRVMVENIRIAQPEVVVRECRPVVVAP